MTKLDFFLNFLDKEEQINLYYGFFDSKLMFSGLVKDIPWIYTNHYIYNGGICSFVDIEDGEVVRNGLAIYIGS